MLVISTIRQFNGERSRRTNEHVEEKRFRHFEEFQEPNFFSLEVASWENRWAVRRSFVKVLNVEKWTWNSVEHTKFDLGGLSGARRRVTENLNRLSSSSILLFQLFPTISSRQCVLTRSGILTPSGKRCTFLTNFLNDSLQLPKQVSETMTVCVQCQPEWSTRTTCELFELKLWTRLLRMRLVT